MIKKIEMFSKFRVFKSLLLPLVVITGALGRLTQAPKNNFVTEGATAEFTCCSDVQKLLFWEVKAIGSLKTADIYGIAGLLNGFLTSGRFNVTNGRSSGCYRLTITNVKLENVGTYTCIDNEGLGQKISWELVILESFNCQETNRKSEYMGANDFGLPQDVISTVCSSKYVGNVPPKPICEWSSGIQILDSHQHVTETPLATTLNIQMPARKEFNGDKLSCYVEIDGESSDSKTPTAWKSSHFIVNHASFHQRGVSECSVDGLSLDCHPPCNHKAISFSNGSSYCEIAYKKNPHRKCYILLQDNNVQGAKNIHTSTHSPVESQTPMSGTVAIVLTSVIAGFVGIGIGVGLTVFLTYCCCKRRYPQRNNEAIEMDERRPTGNPPSASIHIGNRSVVTVNAASNAKSSLTQQNIHRSENIDNNPETVPFLDGGEADTRTNFVINMGDGINSTFKDEHGLQRNAVNTKQKNKPVLEDVDTKKRNRKSATPNSESENFNNHRSCSSDVTITDSAFKLNEEMASWFIVSTCQLLPKSHSPVSDHMHDLVISPSAATKKYSILCGSQAEFYIRPLNTCITDIDFLVCKADELAFSGNFPVLPCDTSGLSDMIACYQIEPYLCYPGFVRLRVLGEMNYNWKYKKYETNRTVHPGIYVGLNMATIATKYVANYRHISDRSTLPSIVFGLAIKSQHDCDIELESNVITGLFCPQWPKEAQNWPKRPREYRWPTTDTISKIVQNGCHVAYVQHRSCRDDELQWRLSFSVAEVILLQSWTQTQQIVYHLLRFFAKKELIQKDCPKEDEVLCPYHFKTLMLWTCEEMSPEWWNSSSVIAICSLLLRKLSEWLKRRHCPNYFIPEANLFYEPSSSTMLHQTERRLHEYRNSCILGHWFADNYILPITRTQFQFLNTRKLAPDFMDYLLPFLEYRKAVESLSLDIWFSFRFSYSNKRCRCAVKYRLSSGLRNSLRHGLYAASFNPKLHSRMTYLLITEKVLCFRYYDILLFILHIAYGLCFGEISWDRSLFVEFVHAISMQPKIIMSQYHNFPKTYTEESCRFQFLRAQDLMRNLTGTNSRSEFQLLSLMSKESLKKALECDDSQFNGIAPAALAYLAALHYATSEFQQTIRICLSALVDQTCLKDKETLNAGCLLFIDDIARIVGLYVLHKKITENNLHYINGRLYLDLRLSPSMFSKYLTILCTERISKHLDFYHDFPESAFAMDEYLKTLLKRKLIDRMMSGTQFNAARQILFRKTDSLIETEATSAKPLMVQKTVIDVLMEIALENMTSFYNVIGKDFGIQCNTVDCYRASYLYKCRQYDKVQHICERILREPDLQSNLKEFSFANVLLIPPIDSFFDRDVQSLLGFHTLFYYLSPLNDDIRKCKCATDSAFEYWFANNVYLHRFDLSTFFFMCYSIKCNYFIGRHFLARYLKVRCCIDCNLPYAEALAEFAVKKTNFPFEHIIRRFLQQKFVLLKCNQTVSSYQ